MNTSYISFSFPSIFGEGNSSLVFWALALGIIIFIAFTMFRKSKNETVVQKHREQEVRTLIKNHLRAHDKITNIGIKYVKVMLRDDRDYQNRDVFDVFIELYDYKSDRLIGRKAYEIEGAPDPDAPEQKNKSDPIAVIWKINSEHEYDKHWTEKHAIPPSKIGIYYRSIFKKNRKEYIAKEMMKIEAINQRSRLLKHETKKNKEEMETKAYVPKLTKKEKNKEKE